MKRQEPSISRKFTPPWCSEWNVPGLPAGSFGGDSRPWTTTAVIGARDWDNRGAAFVFTRTPDTENWTYQATIQVADVFSGDIDRYFKALDEATGKVLWQVRTNNMVNAFPITYSVNGKQYVAVAVGRGSGLGR